MKVTSIFEEKDYGSIIFNFRKIIDSKGITRNRLQKLADLRYETVKRLYDGDILYLDVKVLCKFCYVMNCDISDVMEYKRVD